MIQEQKTPEQISQEKEMQGEFTIQRNFFRTCRIEALNNATESAFNQSATDILEKAQKIYDWLIEVEK